MAEPYDVIAVPGSTSNLGPAFDALAVALDLHLRIRVLDVRADLAGAIKYDFEGAGPAGENRIDSAYQLACKRFGAPVMGLQVRVSSEIPMAAGLGSGAAASVAGIRLYEAARASRSEERRVGDGSVVAVPVDRQAGARLLQG